MIIPVTPATLAERLAAIYELASCPELAPLIDLKIRVFFNRKQAGQYSQLISCLLTKPTQLVAGDTLSLDYQMEVPLAHLHVLLASMAHTIPK